MPRSEAQSKEPVAAAGLRRRAARVRRLTGGMTSNTDYDRMREYAEEMDARATQIEKGALAYTLLR